MRIGVPREIKNHEYRVGLTPASVHELVAHGHEVFVEHGAGNGAGMTNDDYLAAGASLLATPAEVFERAEMIVKVKEPQPGECRMLRAGQVLFTYLHLAADAEQARLLQDSGATAIAYETVTDAAGRLPLLAPMSEVAGRLSVQAGAHCLEAAQGGSGVLLGGVPGVPPGRVVIIGGGVVGDNAAEMAVGLGADVTVLDKSLPRLRQLADKYRGRVKLVHAADAYVAEALRDADLVIGAVLVPGAAAPHVVSRAMLGSMRAGSVLVDVAIDQGGCFETSKPTTHQAPTYVVDGIVHYCVANIPGAVPRTSTVALNNATLPYVTRLAAEGVEKAMKSDAGLAAGLNVQRGRIVCEAVKETLCRETGGAQRVA